MRRVDADRLKKASAVLGETVLDPAVWPQAMQEICAAVGAVGAMLLQGDVRTPDIPRTPGSVEGVKRYFDDRWHLRDIRAERGVPLLLSGATVITDEDFTTPDERRWHPFYADFIRPVGWEWFAAVGFHAGSALWGLTIQRTPQEGQFEEQDKRILAPLSRRLTEVASLSTAVGRIALSSATSALNLVRQPAIAIDRSGFVLDANPAAEALFDDQIHIRNRLLFVADQQAHGSIKQLVDRLRITPDTAALPCDPIVVRRNAKGPVVVRALPVPGAARTPFLGARALLTFTAVEPRTGPKPVLLSRLFGLTPAEAALASIIAEGVGLEQAADQLGIGKETARSQLKAVFAKTATHRQRELLALLARL